jgi:hypothetical protein
MEEIKITKEKIEIFKDGNLVQSGKVNGKISPVLREVIIQTTPTAREHKREEYIAKVNKLCKLFKAQKVTVIPFEEKNTCVR